MAYNTIQAVIIHCKGDVKDLHRPRYQVTQVTPAHPVFNEAVCEVSALVGMAAKLIRVNTPESETVGYRQNGRGTFLKLQLDPTRRQFGFAPFSVPGRYDDWQSPCGNVMVVRARPP